MKYSCKSINRQKGSSIMMAIFVLIVVGLLGSAMVSLLNQSEEGVAREVVSMRALMAAESGAERGLQQALGGACPGTGVTLAPMLNWSFASSTGLQGCDAVVSCAAQLIDGTNYYTIKSHGECGPADSRAHRIIQLQAQAI
jgi:MSHA biogenesis protein MshP